MNYCELAGNFWLEHERAPFNHSAVALYFRLLHEANERLWKGPLKLSWSYLQGVLGLSRGTLARAISDLKSRGLITYQKDGKRGVFWFNFETNNTDRFKIRTEDRTKDRTDHPTSHPTTHQSENVTTSALNPNGVDSSPHSLETSHDKKEKKEKDQKKEEKEISQEKNQEQENHSDTPNGVSRTECEIVPSWKLKLNGYEKQIIELWETLVGPWEQDWLDELASVLKVCYPAQVKQAITAMSISQPHALINRGFPYLVPPLLRGAFGHKIKNKKKQQNWAEKNLVGLRKFLQKEGSGDIFEGMDLNG